MAARCAARLGQIEEARDLLAEAMAAKLRDLELPRADPDFAELVTTRPFGSCWVSPIARSTATRAGGSICSSSRGKSVGGQSIRSVSSAKRITTARSAGWNGISPS